MKLYMAEKQAFEDMECAETLADFVRIGFNAVYYKDYVLYELVGDNVVSGVELGRGASDGVKLDGSIKVELADFTTDDDGYHVIEVKDKEEE